MITKGTQDKELQDYLEKHHALLFKKVFIAERAFTRFRCIIVSAYEQLRFEYRDALAQEGITDSRTKEPWRLTQQSIDLFNRVQSEGLSELSETFRFVWSDNANWPSSADLLDIAKQEYFKLMSDYFAPDALKKLVSVYGSSETTIAVWDTPIERLMFDHLLFSILVGSVNCSALSNAFLSRNERRLLVDGANESHGFAKDINQMMRNYRAIVAADRTNVPIQSPAA
jgi:hypothetical protein